MLIRISFAAELLHLGRDYPLGYAYFRARAHAAFVRHAGLATGEEIETAITRAEYVKKG